MPLYRPHPLESLEEYSREYALLQGMQPAPQLPNRAIWHPELTAIELRRLEQDIAYTAVPQIFPAPRPYSFLSQVQREDMTQALHEDYLTFQHAMIISRHVINPRIIDRIIVYRPEQVQDSWIVHSLIAAITAHTWLDRSDFSTVAHPVLGYVYTVPEDLYRRLSRQTARAVDMLRFYTIRIALEVEERMFMRLHNADLPRVYALQDLEALGAEAPFENTIEMDRLQIRRVHEALGHRWLDLEVPDEYLEDIEDGLVDF